MNARYISFKVDVYASNVRKKKMSCHCSSKPVKCTKMFTVVPLSLSLSLKIVFLFI